MDVSAINHYSNVKEYKNSDSTSARLVNFKAEPDKFESSKKEEKPKSNWLYVLGGLAALGGIALAVKKHKAKDVVADVASAVKPKEESSSVSQKASRSQKYKPTKTKNDATSQDSKKVRVKTEPQTETVKNELSIKAPEAKTESKVKTTNTSAHAKTATKSPYDGWQLSEAEKSNLSVNPSKEYKIRVSVENHYVESNKLDDVVDNIMKSSYPGFSKLDKQDAREVLPTLIKNDEGLQIGGHYQRFLESIDSENKDFAMSQVVPWLVKNYAKMGLKDWYNNNKFMSAVDPENIKYVKELGKTSKALGLDHHSNFFTVVGEAMQKGEDFVFKKAIPTIINNRKAMLNPNGDSTADLIEMLTPKNIDRVFNEDLPKILSHKNELKLEYGSSVVEILQAIDKNGSDFVLNEALPIVLKNSEKLKIKDDGFNIHSLLSKITPENKSRFQLIADNAEKLGVNDRYDAEFMLKDKSEKEISAMIKKKK